MSLNLRKNPNVWVFGSASGNYYNDNSKYLFEYISDNQKHQHAVWLTRSERILKAVRQKGYKAELIGSHKANDLSIHASFYVYSYSYDDIGYLCYANPKKATYVNLWHGIPLKSLNSKRTFLQRLGAGLIKRRLGRPFDLMPTTTRTTTNALAKFFPRQLLTSTGFPRIDALYPPYHQTTWPSNVPKAKHYILYMPTFRDPDNHGQKFNIFRGYGFDATKISKLLKKHDACLIMKLHLRDEKLVREMAFDGQDNIVILQNTDIESDIYPYLHLVDVLVTDYSSIYFDFLHLDRPVVFSAFDLDYYNTSDRGFNFDYDAVTPGHKANDWPQLAKLLEQILSDGDHGASRRQQTHKQFNGRYHDAHNAARVYKEIVVYHVKKYT